MATLRRITFLLAFGSLGILACRYAEAELLGTDVTVTFQEPSSPDEVDVVTVGAGPEISFLNGTNIGDNILLDFESIDVGDTSIIYDIQGGGDPHGTAGYTTTGFNPAAQYVFSGLEPSGMIADLVGVTVDLTDVIDVALGSEVSFDDDSVTLLVGTLGIADVVGGPDLGRITLNLQFEEQQQPERIPEPASGLLCLLGGACLALGYVCRRRRSQRVAS